MPLNRTAVSTAAAAAIEALELLANLIKISNSHQRDQWLAGVDHQLAELRRAVRDDVAAYNRYLAARRTPAASQLLRGAIQDAIDVPLQAARAVVAGLELCSGAGPSLRSSLAADLAVVRQLLAAAARGILVNLDVNLAAPSAEPFSAAAHAERLELAARIDRIAPSK